MKADRNRTRWFVLALAVVLLAVVILWFLAAVSRTEESSRAQRLDAVKLRVENAVTLCYAVEGAYPESLEYLAENYAVTYSKDEYIVHYDCFAANIRPQVVVVEKERGK